jgi:hypothetical protein
MKKSLAQCKIGQRRNESLFSDGIKKHVKRWNWCVEVEADYVEK